MPDPVSFGEADAPKRILITGAAGFVGRHLVAELTHAWPRATLCRTSERASPGIAPLDVTDQAALDAAMVGFRPDAVVHLAALSALDEARRDAARAWRVNFEGTRTLARALLRHTPRASLLFVSSGACYGRSFRSGEALSETAPLEPIDVYAATKAAAEMALSAMVARGLRLVRLRPFTHVGPGQSPAFSIASFALQIARIEAGRQAPELRVGSLTPRRDLLDVRDVCRAYRLCLARRDELAPGVVINVASGTARRIGDVLNALLAQAKVSIAIRQEATRIRSTDLETTRGDPARAAHLLGWHAEIPWSGTLADVLAEGRARIALEGGRAS